MTFIIAFVCTFVLCWVTAPTFLGVLTGINFYTVIMEGHCKVYMLFGRVLGVIPEPGLHLLWIRLGPQAALVRFFGRVYENRCAAGSGVSSKQSGQFGRRHADGSRRLVRNACRTPGRLHFQKR